MYKLEKKLVAYVTPKGSDEDVKRFAETFNEYKEVWDDDPLNIIGAKDEYAHRGTPGDYSIVVEPVKDGWKVKDFEVGTVEDNKRCIEYILGLLQKEFNVEFERKERVVNDWEYWYWWNVKRHLKEVCYRFKRWWKNRNIVEEELPF